MCNHMDLNDRLSIQSSLKKALSFSEIARDLGRDKATISREVKKHRRFISYKDASTLQTHNACKNDLIVRSKTNVKALLVTNNITKTVSFAVAAIPIALTLKKNFVRNTTSLRLYATAAAKNHAVL